MREKHMRTKFFIMKTGKILLLITFCICMGSTFAQKFYRLTNGPVLISGVYMDSLVRAESNKLFFLFDYETNEVLFKLPVKSLISDNKFIDSLIQKEKSYDIIFKGKIITEYDITTEKSPLEVVIEGALTYKYKSEKLSFNATITHLPLGSATCDISSTINLDITKYFDNATSLGINKNVNIIFKELVLERINE